MKYRAAFAAAAVAFCLAGTDALDQPSDVIVLTEKNFNATVKPAKLILVEFYAPWCGHCKALAPEYEKAATELKSANISIAKVDCTVEESVCQEYGVRGYPALKAFREGTVLDYKGERDADAIISYMKRLSQPDLSTLTEDSIDEFKESEDVVVVGFFDSSDTDEQEMLLSVAKSSREEYSFGVIADRKVAEKYGTKTPGLILFKKFDEGSAVFDGKWNENDILRFIKTNAIKLVSELNHKNYGTFVRLRLPIAYLFVENEEQRKALIPEVEKVAKDFRGKMSFVALDANTLGDFVDNVNLKKKWPAFSIADHVRGAKYPFAEDQDITENAVRTLAQQVVNGTAVPNIKSDPVPTDNDGPVTVVVGDTFEKIVKDPTKDVLIEFYAPWCGYCKKLAPIYEEVGSLYKAADDIVVAKMDATTNDLPPNVGFQITGFPTIKFFKAGGDKADEKEIFEFIGNRTVDDFIKFITKNAVSTFTPIRDSGANEEPENLSRDEL